MVLVMAIVATGCMHKRIAPEVQARELMRQGELYRARKVIESSLKEKPQDKEVQELMADILNQEIARQKEAFETKPIEEFNREEKNEEVRTWLERSDSFYQIGHYDQAIEAAEKVFLYDPDNRQASERIDRIKTEMLRTGKKTYLDQRMIAQEEIKGRVERYREQTRKAMERGYWGLARLSIEKILLLSPEDPEGLRLQEALDKRSKKTTA